MTDDEKLRALKDHLAKGGQQARDGKFVDDFSIDGAACELDKMALLERVRPWFASDDGALDWYENEVIASFSMTPAEVIGRHGQKGVEALNEYIAHKERGGFE